MSKIRIVHVSDIHFGQEDDGSLSEQDDVRQALVRDCKRMTALLGSANGIVVTGDIAFSGKKKQYEVAGNWLASLVDTINCPKIAVHTIPGNHDVDVKTIDYVTGLCHARLRSAKPNEVDAVLEKLVPNDADSSLLLKKLNEYNEFASRYESQFQSPAKPVSIKDLVFPSGHRLRFLGFASIQVSDLTDKLGQMVLGNRQYIFSPTENIEYVIMSHHPLEWFKDKALARPRLVNRARVMLFGHEHQTSIRKIIENGSEYIVIDAGSTNPPYSEERRPHSYNWIEFSLAETNGTYALDVTVHPRVWVADKAEFDADRSKIDGQTNCTFSLKCPNYSGISDLPEQREAEGVVTQVPISVREGDNLPNTDDEKFAKLLYYFWRYLDWRQRYEVLAKEGVLPAGLDKPMPQVMERAALENARTQARLSPIWDEVMKWVPAADREANPF